MCHIFTVFSRPPIYFFLYIFTKLSLLFIFAFEFKLVQHIEYLALRSWIRLLGVHVYHHQKLLSITQQPPSIGLFALSRPHFLLCLHYVLDFNFISIWLKKLELGLIVSVFWLQTESLYIHMFLICSIWNFDDALFSWHSHTNTSSVPPFFGSKIS